MGSRVVLIIQNPMLIKAFKALSEQPRVIHVIHNLELFMESRALNS